ncbi:MAG TPA: hypothetical protein VGL53_26935 [Bryobacteraceae bacterium]|jgi:hypothetical protein
MKSKIALIALTSTSMLTFAGSKQDKENKDQLTQVSRIYVEGKGPNIDKVRDRISRANSCFTLAESSETSDAVLVVTLPGAEQGRGVSFQSPAASVQGELRKSGVAIWTDESQIVASTNQNMGTGLAIVSLVNSLEHDAGCGKKKGALAQGRK